MSNALLSEVLGAAAPLLNQGYTLAGHQYLPEHFGNGWVLLTRDDARARIVNERGRWFVELGSSAAPEEWFDARLVLGEIGAIQSNEATDAAGLVALCKLLAETAPRWEVLLLQ